MLKFTSFHCYTFFICNASFIRNTVYLCMYCVHLTTVSSIVKSVFIKTFVQFNVLLSLHFNADLNIQNTNLVSTL